VQNFGQIGLSLVVVPFEDYSMNLTKTRVAFNFMSVIIVKNEQPSYTIYWSITVLSECFKCNEY